MAEAVKATPLEFFDFPLAFNPPKPKLVLVEKNIPFKNTVVNIFNGDSLKPAFLRINPEGSVPSLRDGSTIINGSRKIAEYVDNTDGSPLGGSAVDRTVVGEWLDTLDAWDGNLFIAAFGDPTVGKLIGSLTEFKIKYAEARKKENPDLAETYDKKIAAMQEQLNVDGVKAAAEPNLKQLTEILDKADSQLSSTAFLAGEAFSVADALFIAVLQRVVMAKKDKELLEPRNAVSKYHTEVQQRPSFKKVYGPASSGLTAASLILPALFRSKWSSLFKSY